MYTYSLEYAICSLLFLTLILVHYFSKRQFSNLQNRLFSVALVFAFLDIFLDIVSSVLIERVQTAPPLLLKLVNTAFYSIQIMFPALLMLYVLSLLDKCRRQNLRPIVCHLLPGVIFELLLFTNPLTQAVFYATPERYVRGWAFNLLYAGSGFYIVATFTYLLRYREELRRSHFLTVLFVLLFIIVSVVLQYVFPSYLLTSVAIAISVTMMYLIMQKPEDMLDQLTGVFNREAMAVYLRDRLADKEDFRLILVEVNNIRRANHLFGYDMGNAVLRATAQFMADHSEGWTFRMISNQFTIVCRSTCQYEHVLRALRERFEKPWDILGISMLLPVTVVTLTRTEGLRTSDEAIRLLETALLNVEKGGMLELDEDLLTRLNRAATVEDALVEGIERDAFEVYFQPIYSLSEERFVSAEALLRFNHPTMGFISPGEFIPIAERRGLVLALDALALKQVCRFVKGNDIANRLGLQYLHVNLSAVEFVQEELPRRIREIVDEYGVPHDSILLEITETAASAEYRQLLENMRALVESGFRFALDDYGMGYANISQVAKLPFRMVKLDQSMLLRFHESSTNAVLFSHTVAMLHDMGFDTVVEGVETAEQAAILRAHGVRYAQGYYFARPMPADRFVEFMEKQNKGNGG